MSEISRHTPGGSTNPMSSVIEKAIALSGGWSIEAMREPGFRSMANVMARALEAEDAPFRAAEFRALAPLMEKAQTIIDKEVVQVGLQRLTFMADLLASGLTFNLTDPMSVTQLEYYKQNRTGAAQRTMSPKARGESKLVDMLPFRLPVYLTTDQFDIDIRTLRMSQRVGIPLDTAMVGQCTRSVNEAMEDAAINGATTIDGQDLAVAGYSAPGLMNAPGAEAQVLTAAAWKTAPVGATVFAEYQLMAAKLRANKKFGPYNLYLPTDVGAALDSDYNATNNAQGLTIKQRLLQIEGLNAIKTADLMPATKVGLVQMTKDVVDVVVGQPPTVIPWTSLDGFMIHNLVMAIMIPRFRSDYNGDSGVCIGTLT